MAGSDASEGPVLNLINKRLRALRKKLNRITQMEESLSQGKSLNKEQEEVFRSKPSVTAAIDELDKLRQPLAAAVNEEISLAIDCHAKTLTLEGKDKDKDKKKEVLDKDKDVVDKKEEEIGDLLNLVYFASMFDVRSLNDFTSTMLTRTHERGCCLSYDYVSDDDATDPLVERDLDLISMVGSLLISRPVDTSLSHKNALRNCIEHAKLWLSASDQPIAPGSAVTYCGLREKLAKIMASPYFTTSPEMKTPVDVVAAAAAGNYGSFQAQVEGLDVQYQHKEEDLAKYEGNEFYDNQANTADEPDEVGHEAENSVEAPAQTESIQAQAGEEQNLGDVELKDQHHAPRRRYHSQRGGRGLGGRRGNTNVRGGRNGGSRGGGPYQNGRSQYYDQPGNYYPRNYYSSSGRGGGNGAGGNSYHHGSAVSADS